MPRPKGSKNAKVKQKPASGIADQILQMEAEQLLADMLASGKTADEIVTLLKGK